MGKTYEDPTPPAEGNFDGGNVRVGVTGVVFTMDEKTAVKPEPKDIIVDPVTGAISIATGAWKTLGYFTEDGVSHNFEESQDDIKSWQGGTVRSIVTERNLTIEFGALETNPAVLEAFYGLKPGTISIDEEGIAKFTVSANASRDRFAGLFVVVDGDSVLCLYMPAAQVSEIESPSFNASEAVVWGMTIKALGDRDGNLGSWIIKGFEPGAPESF